jgi:hypothetical protein
LALSEQLFTLRDLITIVVLLGGFAGVWRSIERTQTRLCAKFDLVEWRLTKLEEHSNGGKASKMPRRTARKKTRA